MSDARRMLVCEALAHDIKSLGVEAVFGLMSDDTAVFVSTLDAIGVRFYGTRHENNACSMAEGYAAATGRLGVAVVGRGPATANALHGITYAQRTGSRVLLITGEASTVAAVPNGMGPDTKTFNGVAVLQAAGLRCFVATDPASARRTLAQAVASTAQGATALLLPTNVQLAEIDFDDAMPPRAAPAALAPAPRPARASAVQAAAALLVAARRPLIVAGVGAYRSGAREVIEQLADRIGAVLATTLKAKEMFSAHAYNAGVVGSFSHAAGRRCMDQADCILAIGAGLNLRTTSFGLALPKDAPLIQIDADRSHIGRWFHADVALVGDARLAVQQLLAALPERPADDKLFHDAATRQHLAGHDLASEFQPAHTPRTMDPRSLALALSRLLPADRNIVYDAGNFIQIAAFVSVPGPGHIKQASDFASISMGFGTAMGFAVGKPDRPTVLFIGDGGFMMSMNELETVVREDIPLIIVVMNDCAFGAEVHHLRLRNRPTAKAQFPDVDLAPVAQAFGFQTATVRTLAELEALAPMLRNPSGPILLDCKINGNLPAPFLLEGYEQELRRG